MASEKQIVRKHARVKGAGRGACGAMIDASDLACVLAKDHDLRDVLVRHDNGAGLTWGSVRRNLLNAASPDLADALADLADWIPKTVELSEHPAVAASLQRAMAALKKAGR